MEIAAKSVDELLKAIAFKTETIYEARKRFFSHLALDFTIFDYLRRDEMGVSRIIADLLDPNASHGQGSTFLKEFAKKIGQGWISLANDWKVSTEKPVNGQRRIDIYLESSDGIIGIENKPWAIDQKDQLIDYANYLKEHHERWLLIYLGNNEPSAESITKENRKRLTLSGNLICCNFFELSNWLDDCAIKTKALNVRVFVDEFNNFIRRNINGELDMSEEKEVLEEIRKSLSNISAAFHISNAMSKLKQDLLQLLHDQLETKFSENGFLLVWDNGMNSAWMKYTGFGVKFNSQQDKYLRFEFDGASLQQALWGIRRTDESVEYNAAKWKVINDLMMSVFGTGKQSEWWPWWSSVPDANFKKEYKNWQNSYSPWIDIENGQLATKIYELAVRLHDGFDKEGKLYLLSAKNA